MEITAVWIISWGNAAGAASPVLQLEEEIMAREIHVSRGFDGSWGRGREETAGGKGRSNTEYRGS
jgi:hypothetical protein